jgi:hypothetical protein
MRQLHRSLCHFAANGSRSKNSVAMAMPSYIKREYGQLNLKHTVLTQSALLLAHQGTRAP